ncbi:MAG: lipoyl synthase [Chloroflexi bacterium]|nr:lipoyl synthase [Chloroflexota bacterium]
MLEPTGPVPGLISVIQLGTMEYEEACRRQEALAAARAAGTSGDVLLLVQHPPVITVGRGGGWEDILAPASVLQQQGVHTVPTDRGGRATYHGPGQLVAYPILRVATEDLYGYIWRLEEAAIRTVKGYGLAAGRLEGQPGVWVAGRKIAAIGVAVRDGVTRHGLALNVDPQMAHFDLFIPCGLADHGTTSLALELGRSVDLDEVTRRFVTAFAQVFGRQMVWEDAEGRADEHQARPAARHPPWLRQRVSRETVALVEQMEGLLSGLRLHTVCQEAHCPNLGECFAEGTATFLILGDTCTRNCRFCAVQHGQPRPVDGQEPEHVAEAAARLGLQHVVITSVTRDDLPDGGAGHFAATVRAVRQRLPSAHVEVLIPDLRSSRQALGTVLAAAPDVLNHNLETVPRLYARVRPGADYERSLQLLAWAKADAPQSLTKSGLMLGLGEHTAEVLQVLHDLRQAGCDLLTLGQYLRPSEAHLPISRYVTPEEFGWYRQKAQEMGFRGVASGPLVRSSHHARELWLQARQTTAEASTTKTAPS